MTKQDPPRIEEIDESQYIDENDFKTTFHETQGNNFAPNTQLAFAYDSKADTYYKLRKTNAAIKTKSVSFKEGSDCHDITNATNGSNGH